MLLADFCTRLACGLACMLLCTSPRAVSAAFFRLIMLIVLALAVGAMLFSPGGLIGPAPWLITAAALAFGGSVVWTLGRSGAGRWVNLLLLASLAGALAWMSAGQTGAAGTILELATRAASALLLGAMTAAMLLGHSYLVWPAMSVDPLKRLVSLAGAAVGVRALVAGAGVVLGLLAGSEPLAGTSDSLWWTLFAARWLVGLVAPGIATWMVWQTVKIRSTQSATGILYAGVIVTFLGELMGQVLAANWGLQL
jgi:hypothetical protein